MCSPLDNYFPKSRWNQYLDGTIQDVQYKGHIYGTPWFTDFGLIYYRKDLLRSITCPCPPPGSSCRARPRPWCKKGAVKEGFVFQGNQYEGLVCNALEYINSAGGRIYGPKAASTQAQAAKGLQTMASMITSGASPQAVTTYQEETIGQRLRQRPGRVRCATGPICGRNAQTSKSRSRARSA